MMNEKNEDYQYNRCSSRGICSINPTTASLQEVILLYLKSVSYYGLKAKDCGINDKRIKNLVLNTISVLSSNYEISQSDFDMINSSFKTELPKIIKEFNDICSENEKPDLFLKADAELSDYIRFGEREFKKRLASLSVLERSLYGVLFVLVKSFCINILTYESYGGESEDYVFLVFKVLNLLNASDVQKEDLKEIISDISEKDCELMIKIRNCQEKTYGEQEESEVSFSTTKGKALLVVGSNLRELEQVLDVFEDKEVDIYTHDNMILAHTFPHFREYKNLKGQFGQGLESCLLDFSTFPGPIILTRHSLFNVESLYRGVLFTTDISSPKGVIRIKDNDFSQVMKSVSESKGFKTGKSCDSEKVGFSQNTIMKNTEQKLASGKYNQIILLGIGGYSADEKEYFETFIKHVPEDVLVVSLFCCEQRENIICVNASNDVYAMNRLFKDITENFSQKITLIFPYVERHTLSVIINSVKNKKIKIYVGNKHQTVIKPNVTEVLKTEFGVFEITTPKKDLGNITDVK